MSSALSSLIRTFGTQLRLNFHAVAAACVFAAHYNASNPPQGIPESDLCLAALLVASKSVTGGRNLREISEFYAAHLATAASSTSSSSSSASKSKSALIDKVRVRILHAERALLTILHYDTRILNIHELSMKALQHLFNLDAPALRTLGYTLWECCNLLTDHHTVGRTLSTTHWIAGMILLSMHASQCLLQPDKRWWESLGLTRTQLLHAVCVILDGVNTPQEAHTHFLADVVASASFPRADMLAYLRGQNRTDVDPLVKLLKQQQQANLNTQKQKPTSTSSSRVQHLDASLKSHVPGYKRVISMPVRKKHKPNVVPGHDKQQQQQQIPPRFHSRSSNHPHENTRRRESNNTYRPARSTYHSHHGGSSSNSSYYRSSSDKYSSSSSSSSNSGRSYYSSSSSYRKRSRSRSRSPPRSRSSTNSSSSSSNRRKESRWGPRKF